MAGRRTNLALLLLLAAALVSGAMAFAIGTNRVVWTLVPHGAAGLGIVLLSPWKSAIARRGLNRRRQGSGASVLFAVLVVVALATGMGHATGVLRSFGFMTAMQAHVGSALLSIPLAVWHVFARRVGVRRTDLSRRTLLRAAAVAGGAVAIYAALSALVRLAGLPGRSRRVTGSYPTGSFDPPAMPVTQWLNDSVPDVDGDTWRLVLSLEGREVARFPLQDLESVAGFEPVRALIDCTGGWYAEQHWEGVRLDHLLAEAGLLAASPGGGSIRIRSLTSYDRRFPRADARNLWIATRVGGRSLSPGHGYPARVVAPGRRGFWWVKWVSHLDVDDTPWWWQPPFPLS